MTPVPRFYDGKVVLVTGGTAGIGLGTALVFARHGAQTVLTYAWGSADDGEVRAKFRTAGGLEPLLIRADVSRSDDTAALFETIKDRFGRLDAFISNAASAQIVQSLDDLTERAFVKSLRASTWPTVEYVLAARRYLGHPPRYVVVMSSDGPDRYTHGYDLVAASKAALETLVRYLAFRLKDEDTRVNIVRSRAVRTDAFEQTFGAEFQSFLGRMVPPGWFMTVEEVAEVAFALASGMFDAMTAQIVTVDRGSIFFDGISYVYDEATR
jgi:3-oxoacyl-[acyl-carrier protein] reductase